MIVSYGLDGLNHLNKFSIYDTIVIVAEEIKQGGLLEEALFLLETDE